MSLFDFAETFVLLDLEYTAWEGSKDRNWSGENEHREVVQIAAIKVKTSSLQETDHTMQLVKPKIHPKLSEYFINLTGISQDQINRNGVEFRQALKNFSVWVENLDVYSFGRDEEVFQENCELIGISFNLKNRFFDTRDVFNKYGIPAQDYNSGNITEAFGIKTQRRAHDALNDVRTVLDGLVLLSEINIKDRL